MNLPQRPLAMPTSTELGLVLAAKYESELNLTPVQARRQLNTVRVLVGVAVLVFAYDAVSLVLTH